MWLKKLHILETLKEMPSRSKFSKQFWNNKIEVALNYLNGMVSGETLKIWYDWKVPFTIHTKASYIRLVTVTSHNNKSINLLFIITNKRRYN